MTHIIDPKWLTFLTSQEFLGMLAIPFSLTLLLGLISRLGAKPQTLVTSRRVDALWIPRFSVGASLGLAICFVSMLAIDRIFGMAFTSYFITGLNL